MSPQPEPRGPVKAIRWVRNFAIVDVAGDIDLNTSLDFQQVILGVLDEKPKRVVLNLAEVAYMDSSGVASLVKMLSRARKMGTGLALVAMNERVRSIFEITRLDGIFDMYPTEKEALA